MLFGRLGGFMQPALELAARYQNWLLVDITRTDLMNVFLKGHGGF
jgi:hypothetical protein